MNIATAVSQLDTDFFDERGLPKIYNHPQAPQIGSMNILKKIPQNDAILIPERGEEIQPIEHLKQPSNTPSVSDPAPGSVLASDFPQIEFPLMEVVNQSQIDSPSISDMLHTRETGNPLSKATKRTDFPLKSVQDCSSDKEMRETRDLNVSAKPTQSTRDSCTTNSTIRKSTPGTKADRKEEKIQQSSNNRSVTPLNAQDLTVLQDSLPDPIHFIETGFQSKTANSTQRKGEDKKDTAFQLIQKIHNQLQQVQWDLQRLHSMHKYKF